MRTRLLNSGLSNHLAYILLGRSIFIRYLEDRGAVSQSQMLAWTDGQADRYLSVLNSHTVTYALFANLHDRFNGDLFPIEPKEREAVTLEHLADLRRFLEGTDLETGQLSLWPFDFEYVPIELVSAIYDTFLYSEDSNRRREVGAYYTPLSLVDLILDETLDNIHPEMSILDPACGSGLFLVGAYRRLIHAWRTTYSATPTPEQLSTILQNNIFGIDKEEEAIGIAAFSLYLEMLNYLDNEQITDEAFQFPPLKHTTLLYSDFFAPAIDHEFANRKFDRIVGNMPWGKGTLTQPARNWLEENEYEVGGGQAAPAFLLRAPHFCDENGELALLVPAKSTIFVTSQPHQAFREYFFSNFDVRALINFSAVVYELFSESISPAVAIFYSPAQPDWERHLVYGVPKPSALSQQLGAVVLDTTEVKFLERQQLLDQPFLWKTAQWGTPRDAAFIERLKSLPTLHHQANVLNWQIAEGIQIGGGDEKHASWLQGMPLVPTEQLRPYILDMSVCKPISETVFHRPKTPAITRAPLVLIRQSKCEAAFSGQDVAYFHQVTGVIGREGQESILKLLVAYVNSPLCRYYHFLTSTLWAVERGIMIQWEYKEMPFLIPDRNDPQLEKLLQHFGQIERLLSGQRVFTTPQVQRQLEEHKAVIDSLIFDIYGLNPTERQLVEDMTNFGIRFFEWAKRKTRKPGEVEPVQIPTVKMLQEYAEVFTETAESLLHYQHQTLNATIYQNGAPLSVVSFDLVPSELASEPQIVTDKDDLREKLRQLDALLLEQRSPSLYMRRHVRVYNGTEIFLVRPNEQRFWTQSQARADADEFLAELITKPEI